MKIHKDFLEKCEARNTTKVSAKIICPSISNEVTMPAVASLSKKT